MKTASFVLAATMLAGSALAQNTPPSNATPGNTAPGATSTAPMPGVSNNTGVTPTTGLVDRNSGTAAAAGDRNQAVTTTSANAPQPARGSNSFTQSEARRRIQSVGFQNVTGLHKDGNGVWRGTATKDSAQTAVWLDYKGNIGTQSGATQHASSGDANSPSTAAGRAMDRTLGTNTTGTNPNGSSAVAPRP